MVAPRRPRREGRPRFYTRRKVCSFCVDHVKTIDYKDAARLNRYLSDRAKIEPRRKTGTCATHQRHLTLALKRARHLAMLPFSINHVRLTRWPASRPPRPQAVAAAPTAEAEAPAAVGAEASVAEAETAVAEAEAPVVEAEASVDETEAPQQPAAQEEEEEPRQ